MTQSVLDALAQALGDAVSTEPHQLDVMRTDRSGYVSAASPMAIVTARSIDDVRATMRIANEFRTPVVTRGAGTGLAGGATASAGEIVLSTLAMNQVIELSVADQRAVVEPGLINGDFNDSLLKYGLWFAPDPASRAISTIGGNIATNAGGLLCAKYGVTRESVLGLTVVLSDGRMLELGHQSIKGVTGLDLTALMIGSEGTLGVIVQATVRLRTLPRGVTCTVGAYFATVVSAADACTVITSAGITPAVLELMDSAALRVIDSHLGLRHSERGGAFLLVQTDGVGSEQEAAEIAGIIRAHGGDAEVSNDPTGGESLLALRRAFHPSLAARGTVLIEDISVPRSQMSQMFAVIGELEVKYGITIPTVAHAGDGNLHPNFVVEGSEIPDTVWSAAGEMFSAALALGGTLTGEHGVGILKRRWLEDELGHEQLTLQREIKQVFDPHGILNPGKVF